MKKVLPRRKIHRSITEEGQGPKTKRTKTEHNKEILTANDLCSQETKKREHIYEKVMKILIRFLYFLNGP